MGRVWHETQRTRRLAENCQTKPAKVTVKSKARHIFQEPGHHDKRKRIAKGKPVILTVDAKYLLGLSLRPVAIRNKAESRFDFA